MPNLFERGALQQDTGLLKERWQQEGSEPKDATASDGTSPSSDNLVMTVSSGKKFYCKNFVITNDNGWDSTKRTQVTIKDDTTDKLAVNLQLGTTEHIIFPSPVVFESSVKFDQIDGINSVTVVGWEEDA